MAPKPIHGMKGTPAYATWKDMRNRCRNPNNRQWKDYGGRGITVCPEWDTFLRFIADMGVPARGLTIDRIDNDGPYSPENCRWATRAEQNRNRRSNRMITLDGVTQSLVEWCDELGLNYGAVHSRLRRGSSEKDALT